MKLCIVAVVAFALSVSGEKARRHVMVTDVISDEYDEEHDSPYAVRPPPVSTEAVVVLQGEKGNGVTGVISLFQIRPFSPVFLNGTITGLAPGAHGFHVHQKGDLSKGCTSMAGHFNPYNQPHGAPNDRYRHVGDLGNIVSDPSGVALVAINDWRISLSGVNSIIGRGIVVHEKADDLGKGGSQDSLTTGNAGSRVACGVIGLV